MKSTALPAAAVAFLGLAGAVSSAAGPEPGAKLTFLANNPALRKQLLEWEQAAPDAVAAKIQILRAGGSPARHGAAEALRERGPDARGATLSLLETWTEPPSTFDLHKREDERLADKARRALVAIGEAVVEPLIAALGDADPGVRLNAAQALGEIGDHRAATSLLKTAALQIDVRDAGLVRVRAAEAARRIVEPLTRDVLIKALRGDSGARVVRLAADVVWAEIRRQEGREALVELVTWASAQDDAAFNNALCWHGSLLGFSRVVLPACERALELDPTHGAFRDSRGLARALTGDLAGAALDFRSFVEWGRDARPAEVLEQRRTWIAELEQGRNPLVSAVAELASEAD